MLRGLNPIVKTIIVSILFAAICASGMYFRATVIEHTTFEPNWLIIIAAGLLWFVTDLIRQRLNN